MNVAAKRAPSRCTAMFERGKLHVPRVARVFSSSTREWYVRLCRIKVCSRETKPWTKRVEQRCGRTEREKKKRNEKKRARSRKISRQIETDRREVRSIGERMREDGKFCSLPILSNLCESRIATRRPKVSSECRKCRFPVHEFIGRSTGQNRNRLDRRSRDPP